MRVRSIVMSGIACAGCTLACGSDSVVGARGQGSDAGLAGDSGQAAADGASAASCVEIDRWRDNRSMLGSTTRKMWDSSLRVLTTEDPPTNPFPQGLTSKRRYVSAGRIITRIDVGQPYQRDYSYDDHDNATDAHVSFPAAPDVMTSSAAPVESGTSSANVYDAGGRLVASTRADYGSFSTPAIARVYTEDAEGRCARIESTQSGITDVEVRSYDSNDRLVRVEKSGRGNSTRVVSYDDQGRMATNSYTADAFGGPATRTATYSYLSDGSERIDVHDGFSDIIGEQDSVITRTAACLVIDAEIGEPPDARCRTLEGEYL